MDYMDLKAQIMATILGEAAWKLGEQSDETIETWAKLAARWADAIIKEGRK